MRSDSIEAIGGFSLLVRVRVRSTTATSIFPVLGARFGAHKGYNSRSGVVKGSPRLGDRFGRTGPPGAWFMDRRQTDFHDNKSTENQRTSMRNNAQPSPILRAAVVERMFPDGDSPDVRVGVAWGSPLVAKTWMPYSGVNIVRAVPRFMLPSNAIDSA